MDSINKIDPYKNKPKFDNWMKKDSLEGVSVKNLKIIKEYLTDMQSGFLVARKGKISYIRLNNLKQRLVWCVKNIESLYKVNDITKVTEKQLLDFFNDRMRNGLIKREDGKTFSSVQDYVWVFKAFWHWYQKKQKIEGKHIDDITGYLDTKKIKETTFTFFTMDELRRMSDDAKRFYKILMWFLFDSGIRSPTELVNIKVSDLTYLDDINKYELNIRDEISKTFGRKIKLMLCSQYIREYITENNKKDDDYLFPIQANVVNQYLKNLGKRVFKDKISKGGKKFSALTLYDFRHSSACYWLPRYQQTSALKYRFGWKKDDEIHYYTKFLGMKDTISEEDLLIDKTKTQLEKELEQTNKKFELFQEQSNKKIELLEGQLNKILEIIHKDPEVKSKFIKNLR